MHHKSEEARDSESRTSEIAQLGGESTDRHRTRVDVRQASVAIYNGQRCLGYVAEHRDGFDAITAAGEALGRFNSQDAAARALFEAAAL